MNISTFQNWHSIDDKCKNEKKHFFSEKNLFNDSYFIFRKYKERQRDLLAINSKKLFIYFVVVVGA